MSLVATLRGNRCIVHGYHWPNPQRTVKHHIWPQEFGGPTVVENLLLVCDTGHYNIHQAMDDIRAGRTPMGTRKELFYARLGIDRADRGSL